MNSGWWISERAIRRFSWSPYCRGWCNHQHFLMTTRNSFSTIWIAHIKSLWHIAEEKELMRMKLSTLRALEVLWMFSLGNRWNFCRFGTSFEFCVYFPLLTLSYLLLCLHFLLFHPLSPSHYNFDSSFRGERFTVLDIVFLPSFQFSFNSEAWVEFTKTEELKCTV